ncbi:hypothetical protein EV426DRAFT_702784 [Tirmania nivea]|nr:hypothetical protein EV426DRAFT_702784 [Tirmania nivea]
MTSHLTVSINPTDCEIVPYYPKAASSIHLTNFTHSCDCHPLPPYYTPSPRPSRHQPPPFPPPPLPLPLKCCTHYTYRSNIECSCSKRKFMGMVKTLLLVLLVGINIGILVTLVVVLKKVKGFGEVLTELELGRKVPSC